MDLRCMKFELSVYAKELIYHKVSFPFGVLYLCDNFFISEIFSEIHLNEDKIFKIVETLVDYYGKNAKVCYISNRVNSYSSTPQLWVKALEENDIFSSGAIVYYSLSGLMNFEIENYICPKEMRSFNTLSAAIEWVKNKTCVSEN